MEDHEVQRIYGIHELLTSRNALAIRDKANALIKERGDIPRFMFARFGVAVVCTTDDQADDLHWHDAIATDPEFGLKAAASGKKVTRVTPTFRPEKAMNVQDSSAWKAYAGLLGKSARIDINNFTSLAEALSKRHAVFHDRGYRLSDHALLVPPFAAADGWTMQFHIGAVRKVNSRLFKLYGLDGGGDTISDASLISGLALFLDTLNAEGSLPKTILYSLDDTKNASLAVLAQCYAGIYATGAKGVAGKLQYGGLKIIWTVWSGI